MQPPLLHDFFQITITECIAEIATPTDQNNLSFKMTPFEWGCCIHTRFLAFFRISPSLPLFLFFLQHNRLSEKRHLSLIFHLNTRKRPSNVYQEVPAC